LREPPDKRGAADECFGVRRTQVFAVQRHQHDQHRPVAPVRAEVDDVRPFDHPLAGVHYARPGGADPHRAYDGGELDRLPHLEPSFRAEVAHALEHVSLLTLLGRVTGRCWAPCENDNPMGEPMKVTLTEPGLAGD
jgi:hypothetical protein